MKRRPREGIQEENGRTREERRPQADRDGGRRIGIKLYKQSGAVETREKISELEISCDEIRSEYNKMSQNWDAVGSEDWAQNTDQLKMKIETLLDGINALYMPGQQNTSESIHAALRALNENLQMD